MRGSSVIRISLTLKVKLGASGIEYVGASISRDGKVTSGTSGIVRVSSVGRVGTEYAGSVGTPGIETTATAGGVETTTSPGGVGLTGLVFAKLGWVKLGENENPKSMPFRVAMALFAMVTAPFAYP